MHERLANCHESTKKPVRINDEDFLYSIQVDFVKVFTGSHNCRDLEVLETKVLHVHYNVIPVDIVLELINSFLNHNAGIRVKISRSRALRKEKPGPQDNSASSFQIIPEDSDSFGGHFIFDQVFITQPDMILFLPLLRFSDCGKCLIIILELMMI